MKNLKNYLTCLAVFSLLFTSCSKEDESIPIDDDKAVLSFSTVLTNFVDKSADTKQQAFPDCTDDEPAYAWISLTYGDSDTEVEVVVDILSDENGLFTAYDPLLEIPVTSGNSVEVTLWEFKVFNSGGVDDPDNLIWVAPKAGSEYASFVDNPLREDFTITLRAGSKTYTDVEVLCFDRRDVNKYGYQFFDIIPGELEQLCFFANYCPTPEGRDRVVNYSLELYYYSGESGTENPDSNPGLFEPISIEDDSPIVGSDGGVFFADPLCVAVPRPQDGEADDEPYIYYVLTLEDWPGYYGTAPNMVRTGFLSLDDIEGLQGSGDTVDYNHIFFNCPNQGDPCVGGPDSDSDGVPNQCDSCPNVPGSAGSFGCPDDACVGGPDADGDGIPDRCDSCPNTVGTGDFTGCPNDSCLNGSDPDDDGYRGDCDNCPNVANPDQADSDQDGIGDACDNCADMANEDQVDRDDDDFGDVCDLCPDVASEDNVICPSIPGNNCDTAYMMGDVQLNAVSNPEYPGENWGWGLDFDNEFVEGTTTYEYELWAGAAHNDPDNGWLAGIVRITLDGGEIHVQIVPNEELNVSITESHIFFSDGENWPAKRSPGQLGNNYNEEQSDDVHTFSGDNSFRLIVHAVTCSAAND